MPGYTLCFPLGMSGDAAEVRRVRPEVLPWVIMADTQQCCTSVYL